MSLQDTFYLVGIITMSSMTLLFVGFLILMIYIRAKIGELVSVVGRRLDEAKKLVTNPQKIADTVGEAVIDTALNQVEKLTRPKPRKRRVAA